MHTRAIQLIQSNTFCIYSTNNKCYESRVCFLNSVEKYTNFVRSQNLPSYLCYYSIRLIDIYLLSIDIQSFCFVVNCGLIMMYVTHIVWIWIRSNINNAKGHQRVNYIYKSSTPILFEPCENICFVPDDIKSVADYTLSSNSMIS